MEKSFETTARQLARAWLAVLLLALGPAGAMAQGRADAPAAPDALGRETPRGSAAGYLAACRDGDFETAAGYLDLRSRAEQGHSLARDLCAVLSREVIVDLDALSDEPAGKADDKLPPNRDRLGSVPIPDGKVDLLLQRVGQPDGTALWQVAAVTVARIPDLYADLGYGTLERFLPEVFFEFFVLDMALWQWLALLCLLLGAAVGSWFLALFLVLVLRPFAARSDTRLDDRTLSAGIGPIRLAAAAILFSIGLAPLGLSAEARGFLLVLVRLAGIVAFTWMLLRLADVLSATLHDRLASEGDTGAVALVPPGRKTVKVVIFFVAAAAALDSLGFSVAAVLASLGVGGIAIALAAQKTVENLFGGATLYADRPVRVGDFCRFGDKVGTVEEIGIRSTRLRTLDRTLVTVPNAEFSNLQLENFAARDRMRLFAILGVRYETTPEQLRYILMEVRKLLYAHERVAQDPARIRFVGFGAYSLDLELFAYVETADWNEFLGIREDLLLRIMDIVEASGSGFAFPSQTLYLGQDQGVASERAEQAEAQVRNWRERRELFLPSFPAERIAELQNTVRYPPEGSPDRL